MFIDRSDKGQFFRQPNYNIMTQHYPQETLFDDPHQLLIIREQLTALLNSDQSTIHHLFSFIESQISPLLDNISDLSQNNSHDIHNAMLQLKETTNEQQANIAALSHLTIKMIDYIREQQQLHKSQVEQYEHAVDELRGQLDYMTNKNITIEGDVEMFREQLIAAQSQLEEIAVVDNLQPGKEISIASRDGDEQKQRICQLEGQLQKIKEHLNIVKFESMPKRSESNLTPKVLSVNRSQRWIPSSECNPIVQANIQLLQQQIYLLRQKLRQITRQNQQLRRSLQQNTNKMINSVFNRSFKIRQNLQYQIEQLASHPLRPNRTEKMLPKITSFSNFTPQNQNIYFQGQEIRHLIPDQSVEKFHTLNSQINLNQYNLDNHLANLVFIGEASQKLEGWQAQHTGETENSMPHITSEFIKRIYNTIGTNTEQFQEAHAKRPKQPSQECACSILKKSWSNAVSSLMKIRDLAVSKRISSNLHRTNKNKVLC